MSQNEQEVEKQEATIDNVDNQEDNVETQQNQSQNEEILQNASKVDGTQFDLREQLVTVEDDNKDQAKMQKSQSNIATPTRTLSHHETTPVAQRDLAQPLEDEQQSFHEQNMEQVEQHQEGMNEGQFINDQQQEDQLDKSEGHQEITEIEQQQQEREPVEEQSHHSSQHSEQVLSISKLQLLQSEIQSKDELIVTLQDEIKWLKQSQNEHSEKLQEYEKKHEQKISEMNTRIIELEKLLKEKENDIEQYRNGNQTLHLQDLSVISVHKNNENIKSNINDRKDVTIFEVLNEKQTTADLSELGNNFWLISAERKIQKNNPLYKDYFPKDPQPEEIKNKRIINHPTKKYDKSYWFKYVDLKKIPRYNHNTLLPKLQQENDQQVIQNDNNLNVLSRNEIQQQIIQSIQQQKTFGFPQTQQNKSKGNQIQQQIPFSQKLLANNQKSGSQQQKQIIVQHQQQIQQQQNVFILTYYFKGLITVI